MSSFFTLTERIVEFPSALQNFQFSLNPAGTVIIASYTAAYCAAADFCCINACHTTCSTPNYHSKDRTRLFSHQMHSETVQFTKLVHWTLLLLLKFLYCFLLFSSLITTCSKPPRKMQQSLINSKTENIKNIIFSARLYFPSLPWQRGNTAHRNPFWVDDRDEHTACLVFHHPFNSDK